MKIDLYRVTSVYTSLLWNNLEHTIYKFRGHFLQVTIMWWASDILILCVYQFYQ